MFLYSPSPSTTKRQKELREQVEKIVKACFLLFGNKYVIELILTLAHPNRIRNVKAATKPFNLLNAAVLQKDRKIRGWLRILEPQKRSGVPHIHAVIVTRVPVVQRAYPSQLKRGQRSPRSLNKEGRALRAKLKRQAIRSGFGKRCLVRPLRTVPIAMAKYLAKTFNRNTLLINPHLRAAQRFTMSASLKQELKTASKAFVIRVGAQIRSNVRNGKMRNR